MVDIACEKFVMASRCRKMKQKSLITQTNNEFTKTTSV